MADIIDPTAVAQTGGGAGIGAAVAWAISRWLSSRSAGATDAPTPHASAAKVEELEVKVTKLETSVALLTADMRNIQTTVTELKTMILGVDTGMRGLKTTLDRMTGYMQATKELRSGGGSPPDLTTP